MKIKSKHILLLTSAFAVLIIASQIRLDIPPDAAEKKYANSASRFIDVDGQRTHYRDEGSGFPLVLIHGTGSSLHTWEKWTTLLSGSYRVIRLDLPGFGLTGPCVKKDYSIHGYVTFLHSFLKKIGINNCYMAGNSLGGRIAWNYAVLHQDRIVKMIIIDSDGYPTEKRIFALELAKFPVLGTLLRHVTPRFIISKNLLQVYGDKSKVTDELVTRYYELTLRQGNRQAFIDRAKAAFEESTSLLKTIKVPVLIMWGSDDRWIPVENAYKFFNDLPNSRFIIYKGVGHIPMEEIPDRTAKDAQAFLK